MDDGSAVGVGSYHRDRLRHFPQDGLIWPRPAQPFLGGLFSPLSFTSPSSGLHTPSVTPSRRVCISVFAFQNSFGIHPDWNIGPMPVHKQMTVDQGLNVLIGLSQTIHEGREEEGLPLKHMVAWKG